MLDERLDLALFGQEFTNDPYPILGRLRETEPVRRVVYHGLPAWLVTRYADVQATFTDRRVLPGREHARPDLRAVPWVAAMETIAPGSMTNLDPPAHTRLRKLVSSTFTPSRVERLRPRIRTIAGELLDDAVRRGSAGILRDFAVPLANRVIMNLIGVPSTDIREFQENSYVYLSTDPEDQARIPEALVWIEGYVTRLIDAKRTTPGDDLLSALIAARDEGDRLSESELNSTIVLLVMAGFETTASLIGNGLLALLTHPDQFAALRADPALVPAAVEEMLRYDGAALMSLPKFATEDMEIRGMRIARGEAVLTCWGSANRDPRRFDNPDDFDVRRTGVTHLGFAHGSRYCIGAPLARMEAQVAFEALLDKCPTIELAVPVTELEWRITPNVRGLKELPVRFTD